MKMRKTLSLLTVLTLVLSLFSGVVLAEEDFSRAASSIIDFEEEVEVDEEAEFTARFRKSDGERVDGTVEFFVGTSRDAETVKYDGNEITDENGKIEAEAENGEVEFTVESMVPGDVEVTLYQDENHENKIDDAEITIVASEDVGEIDLTADTEEVKVGRSFTLTAEATDTANWEIEGAEIIFEEKDEDDEWNEVDTALTDEDGIAELDLEKTEKGDFDFQARWDNGDDDVENHPTSEEVTVEVTPGDIDKIEAYEESKFSDVAEDTFDVWFAMADEYGNNLEGDFAVEVTDPEGDTYTEEDEDVVSVEFDTSDDEEDTYEMFKVTVDQDEVDLEGDFEVEGRIAGTTMSASTKVTVSEFGEVEDIELELDEKVVRKDYDADEDGELYATVTLINEYGMEKSYDTDDEEILFSSVGPSVARIDSRTGELDVRGNAGESVINAYYQDKGLEDSVVFFVAGEPEQLDVEVDIEPGELEGEVTMTIQDEDGYRAIQDEDAEDYNIITPEGITVENKEDFENGQATFEIEAEDYEVYSLRAITEQGLTANFDADFTEGLTYEVLFEVEDEEGEALEGAEVAFADATEETDASGEVAFEVEAGEYEYEVTKDEYEESEGTVDVEEDTSVNVVMEEVEQEEERQIITLQEGSSVIDIDGEEEEMDTTPVFQNGRAFLPFRAIGEALGAEVEWDADDESVTANLAARTAIFYLGQTTAFVDGEAFEMDTEPFMDDDAGRTLLPIRFVAEAFDAYVDWDSETREITIERLVN
ncbi:stalk domain-containing protein [Natranaerobius thermophilus]|uniref:Copper amine oxidase domain protein n=1 Tax=Natranaerobius thermophilus (strain ATCC BAA-1301 / DSM 18059 / JW/NM-WN-LF) TaxID=457570 RepID=B2A0U6_NATTJ|nr:stalk domain-containing protein [Natranaerobius thermophilus]ACB85976.1 copper amine oxidase domain protein [Natranaerobius thermophilus JW/NM-WN-LF]